MKSILNIFKEKRLTTEDKIILLKKIILLYKSNMSLMEIITYLKKDYTSDLLIKIQKDISKGERLSKSLMKNYRLDPFIFGILNIGEQTGEIIKSFEIILSYLEKKNKLKNKIISASFYPIILFGAIIILLIFISNYLLPVILEIYNAYDIKISLGMMIFLNIEKILVYLFIILFLSIIILYFIKKYTNGKLSYIMDKRLMKISIYNHIYSYYFFSSLYYFLNAGFTISESLERLLNLDKNNYTSICIERINKYIKNGNRLSKALEGEMFFDNRIVKIVSVGEKSGNIDSSIKTIVLILKEELDYEIDRKSKLIEPVLIIFMGVIIGTVVLFILNPLSKIDIYLN